MRFKWILFWVLIGGVGQEIAAQEIHEAKDGFLRELFQVSSTDTALKDGSYRLFYKGDLLEKGQYCQGRKCGRWQYFNFGSFFEYEYDYDVDSLIWMVSREGRSYAPGDHPCLFNGSPFIPYLYIVNHVFFPEDANAKGLEGKAVLTLEIDSLGAIVDRKITYSDLDVFARVVLQASHEFPEEWDWLPAKRQGVPVSDTYEMSVIFEQ